MLYFVLGLLGCIPSYWIPVDGNDENMELCNEANLTKLDGYYKMVNNDTEFKIGFQDVILKRTRGSCNRMSAISLTDEVPDIEGNGNLAIYIRYVAQSYQEVRHR